jgi:hydroxymethylbilane synthase
MKLVISTRGSKLALWQSNHVKDRLLEIDPTLDIELNVVVTKGDKILDTPLALIGGKGLFTKEIEDEMLAGRAHLSVHSLKDMPVVVHPDLRIAAITERQDVRDAMLSEKYENIDDLPTGARIGTTSLRRRMQLLALRPDLIMVELRGNVDTRIKKLKDGEFDAIILASAGVNRLELRDSVNHVFDIPTSDMIPSMGQGALAIETINDEKVMALVEQLNHHETRIETTVERDFTGMLEGSCSVPIGVNATVLENGTVMVKAALGLPNGDEVMYDSMLGSQEGAAVLGTKLAQRMIDNGAVELLKRAEELAYK